MASMKPPIGAAALFMSMAFPVSTAVAGQQGRAGPPQAHEAPAPAPVQYESPDKSIVALVFPVSKQGYESYESRVELLSKSGRLLAQHDYSSADGEHESTATESRRPPGPRTPISLCTAWKAPAATSPGIPQSTTTAGRRTGFAALTMRSMMRWPIPSFQYRPLTGSPLSFGSARQRGQFPSQRWCRRRRGGLRHFR